MHQKSPEVSLCWERCQTSDCDGPNCISEFPVGVGFGGLTAVTVVVLTAVMFAMCPMAESENPNEELSSSSSVGR